jgi:hypothetical protein
MKHCFLCRWSFGATEYADGEVPSLRPILKCWPGGDRTKEQMAKETCKFYDPEDHADDLRIICDEQ